MNEVSARQLQKYQRRKDDVELLCKEGYGRQEIAAKLVLSPYIVDRTVKQLLAGNRIASRPKKPSSDSLSRKRTQKIISLRSNGATLEEIAVVIGCTKARVGQLVEMMKEKHGEQIFAQGKQVFTLAQVAKKNGVKQIWIEKLCREGEIPCKRRGINQKGGYLLEKDGIAALREIIRHRLKTKRGKN